MPLFFVFFCRVANGNWIIILALSGDEGGLMPRHIIVAAELEAAVRKAVERIPKKDRVRPKEVESKSIRLSLACDPAPGKDACGMQSCASSSNALDEEIPHIIKHPFVDVKGTLFRLLSR